MISVDDIQRKITGLMTENIGDFSKMVSELMKWGGENYEEMSPEGKQKLDGITDELHKFLVSELKKVPDSLEKRIAQRAIEITSGQHISVQRLADELESAPDKKDSLEIEGYSYFSKYLQQGTDFLRDTKSSSHAGGRFVVLVLLHGCINEFLSGSHLVRHRYFVSACTHFRNIYETLDLIELFNLDPKMLEIWTSGTFQEKWNHLRPSVVRKKLQKDEIADDIYHFISDFSSHPGFLNFQTIGGVVKGSDGEGNQQAVIFVGESKIESHRLFAYGHLLTSTQFWLDSIITNLGEFLLSEELLRVLIDSSKEYDLWMDKYSQKTLTDKGSNPKASEVLESLKVAKAKKDEFIRELEEKIKKKPGAV